MVKRGLIQIERTKDSDLLVPLKEMDQKQTVFHGKIKLSFCFMVLENEYFRMKNYVYGTDLVNKVPLKDWYKINKSTLAVTTCPAPVEQLHGSTALSVKTLAQNSADSQASPRHSQRTPPSLDLLFMTPAPVLNSAVDQGGGSSCLWI